MKFGWLRKSLYQNVLAQKAERRAAAQKLLAITSAMVRTGEYF